ncbi:hypothetical protein V6Z12_A06G040100 [Gossypium hirsutum]
MEEEQNEFRRWDQLPPDVLGLIFINLSLQELLTVIPPVCKSWSKAVRGSYCWQDIDLFQWSIRWKPHQLDRMLRMLVTRSSGCLCSLHVAGLKNDSIFSFITEKLLYVFILLSLYEMCWLPSGFTLSGSLISDSIVKQTAQRLSTLTFLDLTYCPKIGAQALEAIGKYCKLLETLCRDMMFLDVLGECNSSYNAKAKASCFGFSLLLKLNVFSTSSLAVIGLNVRL